jgi:hypothetical protein
MQSLKGPMDGDPKNSQANAKWVELNVGGWPYVFIMATRTIFHGEEITVDWMEDYWATQRAALTRILQMGEGPQANVVSTGKTQLLAQQEGGSVFELPQRARMRRVRSPSE